MDVHLYQIFFLVDLYQICNVVPNMEGSLICDIGPIGCPYITRNQRQDQYVNSALKRCI